MTRCGVAPSDEQATPEIQPGASGAELVFEHGAAVDADEAETSLGSPVVGSGP